MKLPSKQILLKVKLSKKGRFKRVENLRIFFLENLHKSRIKVTRLSLWRIKIKFE